jgi:hypothetical protein
MPKLKRPPHQKVQEIVSGATLEPEPQGGVSGEFTIEEHLRVQREIERLAHRVWRAHDGAAGSPLSDWLQAERAVLAAFIATRLAAAGEAQAGTKATPCPPARAVRRSWPTFKLKSIPVPQYQF